MHQSKNHCDSFVETDGSLDLSGDGERVGERTLVSGCTTYDENVQGVTGVYD